MICRIAIRLFIVILICSVPTSARSASPSPAEGQDNTQAQAPSKSPAKSKDKAEIGELDDAVANGVLGQIRDGLQSHSEARMLSAFDQEKFEGYRAFEDQVRAYFEKFEGFRVYFRILQISVAGEKGVVLAQFDVEGVPNGGGAAMRRSNQLRFEMAAGLKGWKIVDMRPREFFW